MLFNTYNKDRFLQRFIYIIGKVSKILLIAILLLASILRLPWLDLYPPGFSGDEAGQGYSAYSILNTGKDEWGEPFPLFPRSFGDFKPPLYTYLTIPSIAIFGLNEFSVRLPASILGILTCLSLYYLAKKLTKNEPIAIWSTLLLVVNPWHIQLSRTASEAGVGVLFFTLGLLMFLIYKERGKLLNLSALFFGIALYSYHSFRFFVILFVITIFAVEFKNLFVRKNILAGIIFLVLIIPILFNFEKVYLRASDVGIFSQSQIMSYFENKGTSLAPQFIDKLFDNKFWFVTSRFTENYLSYFSPTFLFSGSRSDSSYLNFPRFPLIYTFELFFLTLAIFALVKDKFPYKRYIIIWLLLSPIAAALTYGSGNTQRFTTILPLTAMLSGWGIVIFSTKLTQITRLKLRTVFIIIVLFTFINLTFFLHYYFAKLPQNPPESLRSEYGQIFRKIWEIEKNYDEVVISKVFTQPQIFVAYYGKVDPIYYQKASSDWLRYEDSDKLFVDQLQSWNLGKFYFEDLDWENKDSKRINALIVSGPQDFPDGTVPIFSVRDNKGKIKYMMVETQK